MIPECVKKAMGVAVILVLVVIMGSSSLAAGTDIASQDPVTRFVHNDKNSQLLIVTPKSVRTMVFPPTKVTIPVIAVVPVDGKPVSLRRISAEIRGKTFSHEPRADLRPQKRTREEILDLLSLPKRAVEATDGGTVEGIEVDLAGLDLRLGDCVPVVVTARGESDGRAVETSVQLTYIASSYPSVSGWYPGDGHNHTAWSDGVTSLNDRVESAKDYGLKWIVLTDHTDGIGSDWSGYVDECDSAEQTHGILAMPGFECTSYPEYDDALGYWCKEDGTVPPNQTYDTVTLVNWILANNDDYDSYSFPAIAHPYGDPPWDAWGVAGCRYVELLSGESGFNSQSVSKWFSNLRSGRKQWGLAASDSHWLLTQPGRPGTTWIYSPSGIPDRASAWSALKAGTVSASHIGDLGYFTINGAVQGGYCAITPGSNITFNISAAPAYGNTCISATIYKSDQTVLHTFNNPGSSTIWTTTGPTKNTFYIVKFVFMGPNYEQFEAWANPVWVKML